ncbi:zona pellucida sperm-binding protein 3 [Amia ocellicauda]|uniref:zona pellucida sperm-binding protein 3 n=1 Tax=Amia ocellicauda TaxID=2972642 RepID=UPI003463D817
MDFLGHFVFLFVVSAAGAPGAAPGPEESLSARTAPPHSRGPCGPPGQDSPRRQARQLPHGRLDFFRLQSGASVPVSRGVAGPPAVTPDPGEAPTEPSAGQRATPAPRQGLPGQAGRARMHAVRSPPQLLEPGQDHSGAVRIHCGNRELRVEVDRDLFGPGSLLRASDLTLGSGCSSNGRDGKRSRVLSFTYGLHDCGSGRNITDTELIYENSLYFQPRGGRGDRVRVATLHCHYAREKTLSSLSVKPTWAAVSPQRLSSSQFSFSLALMTEDWKPASKAVFYLGETISLQVSVNLEDHMDFKVYIDSCVATTSKSAESKPSYAIVQDHGCLVDSRLTHSMARFVAPRQDRVLRFQIKAFQFENSPSDKIFIHCHVRVVKKGNPPSLRTKSCQYNPSEERWEELEGHDAVCSCCERRACGTERRRRGTPALLHTQQPGALLGDVTVGPLRVLGSRRSVDGGLGGEERTSLGQDAALPGLSGEQLTQLLVSVSSVCALCLLLGVVCLCRCGCPPTGLSGCSRSKRCH